MKRSATSLLLLLGAAGCDAVVHAGSRSLAPWYNISWSTDTVAQRVTLTVDAVTTGWVGFGLAEAGGMIGADMFIGSVTNGVGTSNDYYSLSNAAPSVDEQNDWTLHSATESGGVTSLRFSRAVVTGDTQDHPFLDRENEYRQKILFAVGSSDALMYHGVAMKGMTSINFFRSDGGIDIFHQTVNVPDVYTRLFLTENHAVPGYCTTSGGALTKNVATGVQELASSCPDSRTQYVDFCLDMSSWPAATLIASEFIIEEANTDIVHHFTSTAHMSSDCTGARYPGVGGWAPGEKYMLWPSNAGVHVGQGGVLSAKMTLHYNNVAHREAVDSSGIKLHLLPGHPRPYQVGSMRTGDHPVAWFRDPSHLSIPLGLSRYDYECPASSTQAKLGAGGPLNLTRTRHHMHITGTAMQVKITKPDGTIRHNLRTDWYDYNFQSTRDDDASHPLTHHPSVRVFPGDNIVTTCWYDNRLPPLGRKIGDPATHKFGLASNDEMCIGFHSYLPATAGSKNCGLYGGGHLASVSVIAPGQSESQFTERTFGNPPSAAAATCTDSASFMHPLVGGCAAFDREKCELHGREPVAGSGTALSQCCACKAVMPTTCEDAYFHSAKADQHKTCSSLVAGSAAYNLGCETRLDVLLAPLATRVQYFMPDKAVTLAAVCPRSCDLCGGAALPSAKPATWSLTTTLAGTVAAFDAAAQAAFKAALATSLGGVSASEISLSVTAASVQVTATISTTVGTAARLTTVMGVHTAASLSTALGVTVESLATPTTTAVQPANNSNNELLIRVLAGGIGGALAVAGVVLVWMRRKNACAVGPARGATSSTSGDELKKAVAM